MKDAFSEFEAIWNSWVTGAEKNSVGVLDLLKDHRIRTRQDDGELRQITLSKPISVNSGFVIGLRYVKTDGTQTEDLFRVEDGQTIQSHYKGSLQKQWPEYGGTHKQQVVFTNVATEVPPMVGVNTITMVIPSNEVKPTQGG